MTWKRDLTNFVKLYLNPNPTTIETNPKPNFPWRKKTRNRLHFLFESHPAGRDTGWNDSFYCQASKPSSLPRTCCHEAVNEWHVLSYSAPIRECAAFFGKSASQQLDGQNHIITYCIMHIYCQPDSTWLGKYLFKYDWLELQKSSNWDVQW